jgi:EpsI family protein
MTGVRRRAVLIAGCMAGTAAIARLARPLPLAPDEVTDPHFEAWFPSRFGVWSVDPVTRPLVRSTDPQGKVLGVYDRLFERIFVDARGYRVMLSMAYLARAFEGSSMQLHRPEVCYRYSGYQVGELRTGQLRLQDRALPVTRLLATMPGRTEPITYWVLVGSDVVGEHNEMRKRRILASLRRVWLDGLLVRISSIDPDVARAYGIQEEFADALAAALDDSDRARVFGARI